MKNSKKSFVVIAGILAIFALFFSCEIGLGEAVDTEAPKLEIKTPVSGSIIRDEFRIGGTWSDDGTISSITIEIKRQGTSESEKFTYPGTFETASDSTSENIWYCDVNPLTDPNLRDGSYDIQVSITDEGGHTSTQNNSFTIDNTPPVIVLQRPGAKLDSESPDSYGQSFTLEGQAADDNNVSLIEVKIYSDKECTQEIKTIQLANVPNSINLDVAKFQAGISNDYATIYDQTKVYGSDDLKDAVAKNRYCKIIAYDGAQKYPVDANQTPEDTRGNKVETYYLYEEIASLVLSENKITDLYHMFNGTYDSGDAARTTEKIDTVKTILESKKITTGFFSLNPANNPTFTVSGRNPLKLDGKDFEEGSRRDEVEITNGSKVQIEIATGLDGIPLVPDTLGIYVVECNTDGTRKAGAEELVVVSPKIKKDGTAVLTDETAINNRKELITKSGTSYKIVATLDGGLVKGMKVGNNYLIGVYGCDENLTDVSDFGNFYGFYFASSGSAPKLSIESPSNGITYKAKNNSVTVKGYTTTELTNPDITITLTDSNKKVLYTKKYDTKNITAKAYSESEIKLSEPDNQHRVDFNHVIPASAFNQTTCEQYTVTVASINGDKQTTLDRSVIYDVDGPVIASIDETVYPQVSKYDRTKEDGSKDETKSYLNGDISFNVSIVDSYDVVNKDAPAAGEEDHRPYVEVVDMSNKPLEFSLTGSKDKIKQAFISTPAKQTFSIDTTSIVSDSAAKDVKIRIHAWDRAGNKAAVYESAYTIDQSTDDPFFYPNNAESITLKYTSPAEIQQALSQKILKSVISAGGALTIKITDDDGIGNYTFKIGPKDSADESLLDVPSVCDTLVGNVQTKTGIVPNGMPTDLIFTYSVPTDPGNYLCQLTVTDKTTAKHSYTKNFWIFVTGAAPDVTVETEPENKFISLDSNASVTSFKNTIKINSISDSFTIIRSEKTGATTTHEETIKTGLKLEELTANNSSYVDEAFIPYAGRTENKVTYRVIDNYDHEGTREISYNIDSTKPVLDASTITVPDINNTKLSSFRFAASATDTPATVTPEEKSSGISKIQYTFTASGAQPVDANIMTINGVTSLSQLVVYNDDSEDSTKTNKGFDYATEGVKKIWIRAIDDVGNIGEWAAKEFMFDKADPAVEILQYNTTDIVQSGTLSFETGDKFALKGTASDTNGIATVQIYQKKTGTTYTAADGVDANKGILLATISNPADTNWIIENLPRKDTVAEKDQLDATAGVVATGTYEYTVVVTDKAAFDGKPGNSVSKSVNVKIDTTAPTITLNLSSNNTDSASYGETSLSGSEYTFRGTANDPVDASNYCSGVSKLYYAFTTTQGAPSTDNNYAAYKSKEVTGNSWTIPMELGTETGTDTDSKLFEGKHYLYVIAEDKAGNKSSAVWTSFMVDQKDPEITYEVWTKHTAASGLADSQVTLSSDGSCGITASTAEGYYLKGTVKDANTIKSLTIDETSVTPDASGNWISDLKTTQGIKNFVIVATDGAGLPAADVAGKKTTLNRTVIFDNVKPVFSSISADSEKKGTPKTEGGVTTYTQTWVKGTGSTYFNGSVTENGSGLKSLKIQIVPNGSTKNDNNYQTLALTENWSYSYSIPDNLTENDNTDNSCNSLWVRAEDNAGNVTEEQYFFRYDKAAPNVSLSIDKQYINSDGTNTVTLSGYAYDSRSAAAVRGLKSAKITVKLGGTIVDTIDLLDSTTGAAYGYVTATGITYGNFSKAIQADYSTDGTYTFTLDVEDYAGNPGQSSATVTVDKTLPVTTLGDIPLSNATVHWFSGNSAYISGTATENGSGLKSIKVKFDDESDTAYRTAPASSGWGYNYSIPSTFAENTDETTSYHKVIVYLEDNAGNFNTQTGYFHYDRSAPKGTISSSKQYVNGTDSITFSGIVYDNADGEAYRPVKTASIKINGIVHTINPSVTDGSYTLTVDKDNFGADKTYECELLATDYMGNSLAAAKSVTVTKDTTKPAITSIDNLASTTAADYWIKGTGNETFGGTASDTGTGLDKIWMKIDNGSDISVASGETWTKQLEKNWTENTDGTSSYHTVTVWAVDKAGNKSDDKLGYFRYDKAVPVVTLTASGEYVNGTSGSKVTISGNANDGSSRAVKTLTLTTEKWNGSAYAADTYSETITPVSAAGATFGNYTTDITTAKITADGKYRFTVTATDYAGQSVAATAVVTVDTTVPGIDSIKDLDTTADAATKKWLDGTSTYISGTASDNLSGLNKIFLNIYEGTGTTAKFTKEVTGNTSWDIQSTLSSLAENTSAAASYNRVEVYATDMAGNKSTIKTAYFRYDKAAPKLTGLKTDENYIGSSGTLTVSGNANDGASRSVASVVLKTTSNGLNITKSATPAAAANAAAGISFGDFTIALTKDDFKNASGTVVNGVYSCTVTVTDYAGKTTEKDIEFTVDTEAPTVAITGLDATATETTKTWVKGSTGSTYFSGTAADNTNGTGLEGIYVSIDGRTATKLPAGTNWTYDQALTSLTENTDAADSYHTVKVYSMDKAGNKSADVTKYFRYDKAAPSVSLSIDKAYINLTNTVTLSGYAHDGRSSTTGRALKSAVITVTKADGTTVQTIDLLDTTAPVAPETQTVQQKYGYVTTAGTTYGNFSKTIQADYSTDGTYTFTLDVEDYAGLSGQSAATVTVDKTKPTGDIDADMKADISQLAIGTTPLWVRGTSAKTFTGVADADVKVLKVKIDSTEYNAIASTEWSFKLPATAVAALAENTTATDSYHTINIYLEDIAGNISNYEDERYFRYDKEAPSLTLSADGEYVNGESGSKVTLSGNTYDNSRAVKSLVLKAYAATSTGYNSHATYEFNITPAAADVKVGETITTHKGDYSFDLTTAKIGTDGKYKFILTATDWAGDETSENVIVTVDKVAPTGSVTLSDTAPYTPTVDSVVQNWYGSSQIAVRLSGITEATSGIETVEAKAIEYGTTDASPTTGLTTLTKKTESGVVHYEGKVTAAVQGKNQINFRITDKAGNVETTKNLIAYVDTEAPDTEDFTLVKVDEESGTGFTTKLTNRNSDVVVIMDLKDKDSRTPIASVALNKTSATSSAAARITAAEATAAGDATLAGKWKLTIKKADLPTSSGSLGIKVIDSVGNYVVYTPFSFRVDTVNPTVSFGTIADAVISTTDGGKIDVNKTISIPVNISDDQEIGSYTLKYSVGDSVPSDWTAVTTTLTIDTSTNPWSATLDTTNLTDEKNLYLQLTATDRAGNSATPVVKTLYINQNSDRPVVKFTNLVKDGSTFILKYGTDATLEGTITDDDSTSTAIVKQFVVSGSACTVTSSTDAETGVVTNTITGATGTTNFTASTGDFKFTPLNTADGSKDVYFYIEDNNGNVFYTAYTKDGNSNAQNELCRPYQQFKTDAKVSNDAKVTYLSDGTSPVPGAIQLNAYQKTVSGGTATYTKTTGATLENAGVSCRLGGTTRNAVEFVVTGSDANGIKGYTLEVTQGGTTKYYRSSSSVGSSTVTWETGNGTLTNSNQTWTLPKIDLLDKETLAEGSGSVVLTVYDNCGLYSNKSDIFTIDNTAPSITNLSPATGTTVYGSQENQVSGTIPDGDTAAVYYAITTTGSTPSGWQSYDSQSFATVALKFDGKDGNFPTLHTMLGDLYYKYKADGETENNSTEKESLISDNDDNKDVYVHFKTVDTCGNEALYSTKLVVIPNGDKPALTLTYPEVDNKATAGTIRIYGGATVQVSTVTITDVFVQLDPSYDTTFNENWETELSGITNANYVVESFVDNKNVTHKGIKASGTQNWNLPLNTNKEFNGGETTTIAVKIYARSSTGKLSDPITRIIKVDPNAPVIGGTGEKSGDTVISIPLQLVQFNNTSDVGDYSKAVNKRTYAKDMWVTGKWYLMGTIYDDQGIKEIKLDPGTGTFTYYVENGAIKDSSVVKANTAVKTGVTNYDICIPLPTDSGVGSLNYSLEATEAAVGGNGEGSNLSSKEAISVKFDNVAPRIATYGHDDYGMIPTVVNSDGFYQLKSYFDDSAVGATPSGLKGVAFYFVRRLADKVKVYDPMYDKGSAANSVQVATISSGTTTNDTTNYLFKYGLYWKKVSVTRDSNNLSKLTLGSADANIHKGSFAMFDGSIFKVTTAGAETQTEITVDGNPPLAVTDVYFAVAQIVDHDVSESSGGTKQTTTGYGYGYWSSPTNDDGDRMVETLPGGLITSKWTAQINSRNIADGPIEIHYVVMDESQNYSVGIIGNVPYDTYKTYGTLDIADSAALKTANGTDSNNIAARFTYDYTANSRSAYVSNNAPRLAGVTIATDTNGNGVIDDSEKVTTYQGTATSRDWNNAATTLNVPSVTNAGVSTLGTTSVLTIKGHTELYPEIIGGNGVVKYNYDVTKYGETSAYTGKSDLIQLGTGVEQGVMSGTPKIELSMKELLTKRKLDSTEGSATYGKWIASTETTDVGVNDGDGQKFTFTIWDSTEGTVCGSTSQKAVLNLRMNVGFRDGTKPTNVIFPFYWNSASDNSLFENSTSNGHIELEGDLTFTGSTFTASSGVMDKDPKVSGKIKIEGLAHDNIILTELSAALGSKASTVLASYDYAGQKWYKGAITRDAGTGAITNAATDIIGYIDTTEGSETLGQWIFSNTLSSGAIPSDGYAFELSLPTYEDLKKAKIISTYPSGKRSDDVVEQFSSDYGHVIKWTIYVDTANTAITSTVAKADHPFTVGAKDKGSPTLNGTTVTYSGLTSETSGDSTTTGTPTGKYQVDVVPYVTKVYTAMAALQKQEAKWSITSRTANGHYPVRVVTKDLEGAITGTSVGGETIKLYGFNLGDSSKKATYTDASNTSVTMNKASDSYGEYVTISAASLKATSSNASGEFSFTVNEITNLNNSNANNAKGSYTYEGTVGTTGDKTIYGNFYNRVPNGNNNNNLTDDLIFDVWELNSAAAVPISGKIEQPVMKIRPTDGKIGFAFVNGPLYFSMGGATTGPTNNVHDYSYQYWMGSFDFFTSIGFTYDALGNSYGVAAGGDINSDPKADKFKILSSRWGRSGLTSGGSYGNTGSYRLESIGQYGDNYGKNAGTVFFDKQRIKSPTLATTINGTNTNIYLAYYDALNDEIRFKAGQTNDVSITYDSIGRITYTDQTSTNYSYAHTALDIANDDKAYICDAQGHSIDGIEYTIKDHSGDWFRLYKPNGDVLSPFPLGGTVEGQTTFDDSNTDPNLTKLWTYSTDNRGRHTPTDDNPVFIRVIGKNTSKKGSFVDYDTTGAPYVYRNSTVSMIAGSHTGNGTGEYLSIAAINGTTANNDVVVITWFDSTSRELKYSYNTTPMTNRNGSTDFSGWSTPETVFVGKEYSSAGEYCKIAVDANGGIHIAAYDPINLDLVYAYKQSYNTGSFATCIVDSNGVVGSNLTLDVGKVSAAGNVIPYIGYYATSTIRPKMAYFKDGFAANATIIADGAIDDEYTGAWECSIVPTNSTVEMQSNQHNDINIGVWKNAGVLIDSTDTTHYTTGAVAASSGTTGYDSAKTSTYNSSNSYSSDSYGQVYGNGTKNAVLGYAVKHGASGDNIETAQMK